MDEIVTQLATALKCQNERGLEWVPQPVYSDAQIPISVDQVTRKGMDVPGHSGALAEDDDPLPAVEALGIYGEAFPGRALLASGYPVNGTTSCNFEWVRHMEDGSVNYIEGIAPYTLTYLFMSLFTYFAGRNCQAGAAQPMYLVTADDVDTYLAVEVQPMDDRKRKVGKFGLEEEVERLQRDKNVLMMELVRLRQQQQTMDNQMQSKS